ncbi:MAG: diacylglycerol kinase family protein [Rhodothermaceae bacterium]
MGDNKFSLVKRIKSFYYAWNGIKYTVKSQHNMWIHLIIMCLTLVLGVFFELNFLEWGLIFLAVGIVLLSEIFNTAIELIIDILFPEYNKKAGLVKDLAAGAVLVAAITSVIIGLLVFLPKIFN